MFYCEKNHKSLVFLTMLTLNLLLIPIVMEKYYKYNILIFSFSLYRYSKNDNVLGIIRKK